MTTTTPRAVLTPVTPIGDMCPTCPGGKISIIGAGTVGTAIAFTLLAQKICKELVLIDKNESVARGEMLDIQHACMYLDSPMISSSADYEATKDSRIVILTAGIRNISDDKLMTITQNLEIYKEIVPKVMTYSSDCILIICSFPVDEMSYIAWKLSRLPPHRVIGSGNILESSRFRCKISEKLGVNPLSCQAYVIGEHGPDSIPVWSSVSVAGVRLRDVNPDLGTTYDPESWEAIHEDVVRSAQEVAELKDCGSWGMALSIARIVRAILQDTQEVFSISTHVKGCRHGVDKDVFISLPCIVGCTGVKYIIKQHLNVKEKEQLQNSADKMYEMQKRLGLQNPPTEPCD